MFEFTSGAEEWSSRWSRSASATSSLFWCFLRSREAFAIWFGAASSRQPLSRTRCAMLFSSWCLLVFSSCSRCCEQRWELGDCFRVSLFVQALFQNISSLAALRRALPGFFLCIFSYLTCLKKSVFSKRDLLRWKVPARLYWDLLIHRRY